MIPYTEEELNEMTREQLIKIIESFPYVMQTKGRRRDVLIEDILDMQEEKGASAVDAY